jgi:hypothetical protein
MRDTRRSRAFVTHVVACAIMLVSSNAQAEPVNFWTNRTSENCVFEDTGNIAESVRLSSCQSGFAEGTVTLSQPGTWFLTTSVQTDEDSLSDLTDTVDISINGNLVGTFFNAPRSSKHPVSYTVTGSSFTYRFDFSSGKITNHLHMRVDPGEATPIPIGTDVLRWWTNLTNTTCLFEDLENGIPESVRLDACATATANGTISLPADDTWLLSFSVATDEDAARDIADTLDVFINETLVGSFSNDPAAAVFPIDYVVQGSSFTYRFEYASGNPTNHLHMRVNPGTATPAPAVPALGSNTVVLLGALLVVVAFATLRFRLTSD